MNTPPNEEGGGRPSLLPIGGSATEVNVTFFSRESFKNNMSVEYFGNFVTGHDSIAQQINTAVHAVTCLLLVCIEYLNLTLMPSVGLYD